MTVDTVTVQGSLRPDGTLELPSPIALPPGPVEVTVRAVAVGQGEDVLTLLARIRAEQQAAGRIPRSHEEIDADIRQMRDEWEERQLSIEQLQEECGLRRDGGSAGERSA
jgi:hypothetical protein